MNDFSYFGHAMLVQKTNKHLSKIHHKTALESTPKLDSILEPTWPHFGKALRSKMGPSSSQIASKDDLRNDDKKDTMSDRSWYGFWQIWSPIWDPRWSPTPSYWSQDRANTPKLGAKMGQGPPTCSQGPILISCGPHFGLSLIHI